MTLSSRKSSALALSVDHLSKRFGDRTAFDNVSFAVGHGEVFGFLGPNGAGKTTTVRTLGTLIAPTSGSAMVAGLALTPESLGLYLRLTVTENLECFAGLHGLSDSRKRIDRTLHAVNLERRANDPCGALSKGLRQRVSLARALLSDADVLFTPLLALFSIWVGIGISSRSRDVRVAQQLGAITGLPVLLVAYLTAFNVIHATLDLALGVGVALLILDGLGWRIVSAAFGRERLISGTKR